MTLGETAVHHDAAQKPLELDELAPLLPYPLGMVVEVGSAEGGLAWFWHLKGAPKVICIDNRPDLDKHRYPPTAHLIRFDSHAPSTHRQVLELLPPEGADVVFIDADHTEAAVRQDWADYWPMVRPGGLCCFHDIVYHPHVPHCRVDRLWEEITLEHRTQEIITEPLEWGGIGVVFKE